MRRMLFEMKLALQQMTAGMCFTIVMTKRPMGCSVVSFESQSIPTEDKT